VSRAPTGRVTVLVSDAHPLYREALERTIKSWPEFALLTPNAGETLYQALERAEPRVLLIDPATAGVDRTQLLDCAPDSTRVLIITCNPVPAEIYTSLANGAAGYLGKDCPAREVCDAIAAVARGEEILGASIQPALASEIRLRAVGSGAYLTDREHEILVLIADGMSAPEIGRQLTIGTATVKTHLHHIYERLGARERAKAVATAMRRGLIE
jgi:two-component system nitrate/nitrite response regulator NarL